MFMVPNLFSTWSFPRVHFVKDNLKNSFTRCFYLACRLFFLFFFLICSAIWEFAWNTDELREKAVFQKMSLVSKNEDTISEWMWKVVPLYIFKASQTIPSSQPNATYPDCLQESSNSQRFAVTRISNCTPSPVPAHSSTILEYGEICQSPTICLMG